jgi:hypothetical protein
MSSGDNRIAKETGLALVFVAVVLVVPVVVLSVREFQRRSQQRRRDQSYHNTGVALPAAHGTYLRSGAEVLRIAVLDDSFHGRDAQTWCISVAATGGAAGPFAGPASFPVARVRRYEPLDVSRLRYCHAHLPHTLVLTLTRATIFLYPLFRFLIFDGDAFPALPMPMGACTSYRSIMLAVFPTSPWESTPQRAM